MLPDVTPLRLYFAKLGLEHEIADIYLALHVHGPQSISELARTARIERTRIYRLIDKLMASNLIEVETHAKRGIIKAAPIANLNILIHEKEQALQSLQEELTLIEQVLARNSLSSPTSRVQFYHGSEGIRQMHQNILQANTEIVGYDFCRINELIKREVLDNFKAEFVRLDLKMRMLTQDDSRELRTQHIPGQEYRSVAPSAFPITHSCKIFDTVVSYSHVKDSEIFGMEIYNGEIADAQRHFFERMWTQSEPLAQT